MMIYAWQEKLWNTLIDSKANLPHAQLLYGQAGIGKRDFAENLAHALLCESPANSGAACGGCAACRWLAAGTHPDYAVLQPDYAPAQSDSGAGEGDTAPAEEIVTEKAKKQTSITVAQVRKLIDFVSLSSSRGGRRVVLVHPAETMNVNAANALLKTLEEPQPGTMFLLVSNQMQKLPPTVRSRCLKIAMPSPSRQEALEWLAKQGVQNPEISLAQAGNAPLKALDLTIGDYQEKRTAFLSGLEEAQNRDPLALAEMSEKWELAWVLNWLQTWVYDLVALKTTGSIRFHLDFMQPITISANQVDLLALLDFQRDLLNAQRSLQHPLNTRLLLERLLLTYWQIMNHKQERFGASLKI